MQHEVRWVRAREVALRSLKRDGRRGHVPASRNPEFGRLTQPRLNSSSLSPFRDPNLCATLWVGRARSARSPARMADSLFEKETGIRVQRRLVGDRVEPALGSPRSEPSRSPAQVANRTAALEADLERLNATSQRLAAENDLLKSQELSAHTR